MNYMIWRITCLNKRESARTLNHTVCCQTLCFARSYHFKSLELERIRVCVVRIRKGGLVVYLTLVKDPPPSRQGHVRLDSMYVSVAICSTDLVG